MLSRLTFFRFPAAMIVVIYHYHQALLPDLAHWPVLRAMFDGPVAVSYFYTLSGLIMAYVYGGIDRSQIKSYWIARLARIYPVYLLTLVICLAFFPGPFHGIPLYLLGIQAFVPTYALSITSPAWSISTEAFFYVLFPYVMISVRRLGHSTFGLFAALSWVVVQAGVGYLTARYDQPAPAALHDLLFYFPVLHLPSFFIGMWAGCLLKDNRLRMSRPTAALLAVATTTAYFTLYVFGLPFFRSIGISLAAQCGLFAPVFVAFDIALFFLPSGATESGFAVLLGESSYSLYLLQMPVGILFLRLIAGHARVSEQLATIIAICGLVAASIAVFLCFETPARQWLRSWLGRLRLRRSAAPACASS